MDHIITVAVLDGFEQLVNEMADLVEFYAVRVLFQDLEQIFIEVFEDEIQPIASEIKLQEMLATVS